ncbi:MAG: PilN domain-containing protein [Acidobacteriota bacterium]
MIKVNLLSPEKKEVVSVQGDTAVFTDEERESKVNVPAIAGAAVLTLAIIGGLFVLQTNKLDFVKKHLEERKARLAELDEVLKTLKVLEKTKKMLEKKVTIIQDLNSQKQHTVKMMDQLSRALPEMVWLRSVKYSNNVLSLSGSALSNNQIADFINNLKSTNYFFNIDTGFKDSVRKKKLGVDVYEFRFQCTFRDISNKKGAV